MGEDGAPEQNNDLSEPIKQNEMKENPAAYAFSRDRCANVPGSSLFVHKDKIANHADITSHWTCCTFIY